MLLTREICRTKATRPRAIAAQAPIQPHSTPPLIWIKINTRAPAFGMRPKLSQPAMQNTVPRVVRPGRWRDVGAFPLTILAESTRKGGRLAPDRGVGGWGVRGHWRDRGVGGDQQPVAKRETWQLAAAQPLAVPHALHSLVASTVVKVHCRGVVDEFPHRATTGCMHNRR